MTQFLIFLVMTLLCSQQPLRPSAGNTFSKFRGKCLSMPPYMKFSTVYLPPQSLWSAPCLEIISSNKLCAWSGSLTFNHLQPQMCQVSRLPWKKQDGHAEFSSKGSLYIYRTEWWISFWIHVPYLSTSLFSKTILLEEWLCNISVHVCAVLLCWYTAARITLTTHQKHHLPNILI